MQPDRKTVIVLDVIQPGKEPPYCVHGKTTCMWCDEWCWLGDESLPLVQSGKVLPICQPCAIKYIPQDSKKIGNAGDHLRADGPHE